MKCATLVLLLSGFIASASAAEVPAAFPLHEDPRPLPELRFVDGENRVRTLNDFRGKVVVLNIWATWCVPCRREMPTLDRLQAALGRPEFEVLALSIDRGGLGAVRRFFGEIGVRHLALYLDSSGRAARDLAVIGLPTTLLIDREGRELGRLVGPAEWDSAEMLAFLRVRIQRSSREATPTGHPDPIADRTDQLRQEIQN